MKKAVIGILAHVDAGKTTLSEALLYETGSTRKEGSVDAGTSLLDYDPVEAERGITVFSSQAELTFGDLKLSLLDTPGHVDFSGEMERTLSVLDYAILLISGPAGVQSHTRTLWDLLDKYRLPVVIFVNKMDIAQDRSREKIMTELRKELSDNAVAFPEGFETGLSVGEGPEGKIDRDSEASQTWAEEVATADEEMLDSYMETGKINRGLLEKAVRERRLFPVVFGSARSHAGVQNLLSVLSAVVRTPEYPEEFGARVYKVDRDDKGNRISFLKITGGSLAPRTEIVPGPMQDRGTAEEGGGQEEPAEEETSAGTPVKITELRKYQGNRYETVSLASAGDLIAIPGLTGSLPGMGYGFERQEKRPSLTPVFRYRALPEGGASSHTLLVALKELNEEDPLLHVEWTRENDEIHLRLMGPIQKEILARKLEDKYGLKVSFDQGEIRYMETIREAVEGHGHFEPLRHYADVRLRLEPLEAGEGISAESICPTDVLEENYQHQILRTLRSGRLTGVLTDSGLADIRFVLVSGASHKKHTVGGDFRKATELAVRDALLRATNVLLEPYYRIHLTVPAAKIGRALNDLTLMKGKIEAPVQTGDSCMIEGYVPVSELGDYQAQVNSYTGGLGRLSMEPGGYLPCHNAEEVVREIGYDYRTDPLHPYQNIYVHREYLTDEEEMERELLQNGLGNPDGDLQRPDRIRYENGDEGLADISSGKDRNPGYQGYGGLEPDLQRIFEATYGKIERKDLGQAVDRTFDQKAAEENKAKAKEDYLLAHPAEKNRREEKQRAKARKRQYVLVDAYNVIFTTPELRELSKTNFDAARGKLLDLLSNYQGHLGCTLIVVFDAYKVKGNPGSSSAWSNLYVVYTKEAQTADAYIERTTHEIARREDADITVITSDGLEQMIVAGEGARRISSREFTAELERVNAEGLELFRNKNKNGQ